MDAIYGSYDTNATAKINIGEYFAKYKQLIVDNNSAKVDLEEELSEQDFAKLSQRCSINNLITEEYPLPPTVEQIALKKKIPKIPTDFDLQTLYKLQERYASEPKIYRPALKYRNEITVNYNQPIENGMTATPGEDILVYIRIYHPFRCQNHDQPRKRLTVGLDFVIVILGHQTLAQLRDKIDCISDLTSSTESSDNPTVVPEKNNKDIYKSSFFYIEDTFYNDTRQNSDGDDEDDQCKDISAPIINWAKTRQKLGPFHTKNMEDVRIDSLSVKFGYPWVFQHQGNCEHLVTFSDARLVDSTDHLAVENYPRIFRTKQMKHPYCLMCYEKPVEWIVIGSNRIPHDPTHLCQICHERYNYLDGKKIGTFKAYRYPHNAEILKFVNMKKEFLNP